MDKICVENRKSMRFKGSSIRGLVVPLHGVNKQNLQVITLYAQKFSHRFSLARDIFFRLGRVLQYVISLVDDDNWCTWEYVTTEAVCISRSEGLVTRIFFKL